MTQDEINAVKKAAEKMRKQQSAQDEIIEMAREAGLYQDINVSFHQALRNFYDLATAKEQKKCKNTPPALQRTWVGLTEENFSAINQSCLTKLQAAASAEQILMEKNNG